MSPWRRKCPGAGVSPQVPSQLFGAILPATAGEARLRRVERPAVSAAEGSPMFAPPTNFQPRASSFQPLEQNFHPPTSNLRPLELLSPLQSTVTKNASANPLESALTQSLDLNSPGIKFLQKKVGGGSVARKSAQYFSGAASGKPRVTGAAGATSANGWSNVHRAQR